MKTKLDRLLMRYATRHVVRLVSLSRSPLPKSVRVLPVKRDENFRFHAICNSEDDFHVVSAILRSEKKLYSTHLETKPGMDWAMAPGSITYNMIWSSFQIAGFAGLAMFLFKFLA